MNLHPWQRPIREITDCGRVDVGDYIALDNGLLVALPDGYAGPPTVVYALPAPQEAPEEFRHAVEKITHELHQGAIRRMGANRNSALFCALPAAHLSKLVDGKLVHADSPGKADPPFLPYHVHY